MHPGSCRRVYDAVEAALEVLPRSRWLEREACLGSRELLLGRIRLGGRPVHCRGAAADRVVVALGGWPADSMVWPAPRGAVACSERLLERRRPE